MSITPLARLDSLTPNKFAEEIEKVVRETNLNYIQAIIFYCDKYGLDIEAIPDLINSTIKSKIQLNAEDLHLLPRSSKLPI